MVEDLRFMGELLIFKQRVYIFLCVSVSHVQHDETSDFLKEDVKKAFLTLRSVQSNDDTKTSDPFIMNFGMFRKLHLGR